MKRYTEQKAASAANRILSDNRRNSKKEALYNPIITDKDDCIVMNEFYALVFSSAPAGIIANIDGVSENNRESIKALTKLVESFFDYTREYDPVAVDVPSDDAIKVNPDKAQHRIRLSNGQYVNPAYLRNILQAFPDARMYSAGRYKPVLFLSDHGRAALLPIRVLD